MQFDMKSKQLRPATLHKKGNGYLRIHAYFDGKQHAFQAHRVVWMLYYGEIPKGKHLDHINGIKTDNRIENLRLCTPYENSVWHYEMKGNRRGIGFCNRGHENWRQIKSTGRWYCRTCENENARKRRASKI